MSSPDSYLVAIILGIVEGLTEFLPISSTGHLILAGDLLGYNSEKAKVFEIAIQTGAILAVIIVYWNKISTTVLALPSQRLARRFALNVLIGFLPAVVLGLLMGKAIKAHLFTPTVVASTFIVGGFIILWAERRAQAVSRYRVENVDDMSPLDESSVPSEVMPLVSSVNDLLTRLKHSIATQKRFLADAAHQLFAVEAHQFDDAMRRVSVLLAMWFVTARGQA
mgnify:CR=1 FL=1